MPHCFWTRMPPPHPICTSHKRSVLLRERRRRRLALNFKRYSTRPTVQCQAIKHHSRATYSTPCVKTGLTPDRRRRREIIEASGQELTPGRALKPERPTGREPRRRTQLVSSKLNHQSRLAPWPSGARGPELVNKKTSFTRAARRRYLTRGLTIDKLSNKTILYENAKCTFTVVIFSPHQTMILDPEFPMRRVICFKSIYSTWFIVLRVKPHRVGDSKRGRGRWMKPLSVKNHVTYVQLEVRACVCVRFSAQGSKAWPWPWIKLSPAPRLTNTSVRTHPLARTHAWTLRRHWTSVPHITQTAKHQRGVHHLHRERERERG